MSKDKLMKICESQMATICLSSFEYLSERDTKCLLKAWRHKIFRYGMLTFHQYFVWKHWSSFQLGGENLNQRNHNSQSEKKVDITINQWELKVKTACFKREKTRVPRLALVTVLYLIGRDGGVSFQDQSQSEVIRKEIRDQYSFENNSY